MSNHDSMKRACGHTADGCPDGCGEPQAQFDPRHPHEIDARQAAPVLTADGSCLLCRLDVRDDELRVSRAATDRLLKLIGGCEGEGCCYTGKLDANGNEWLTPCDCLACRPENVLAKYPEARTVIDVLRIAEGQATKRERERCSAIMRRVGDGLATNPHPANAFVRAWNEIAMPDTFSQEVSHEAAVTRETGAMPVVPVLTGAERLVRADVGLVLTGAGDLWSWSCECGAKGGPHRDTGLCLRAAKGHVCLR